MLILCVCVHLFDFISIVSSVRNTKSVSVERRGDALGETTGSILKIGPKLSVCVDRV